MERMNETTRRQKVKYAIHNIYKGLKTFGIISPENPMNKEVSDAENERLRARFKRWMKDGYYVFVPLKGKYNREERSYFLCNVSFGEIKNLATEFEQESFIFSFQGTDRRFVHQYWEWNSDKGLYENKSTRHTFQNRDDAENFFSKVGDFKFKFPFFDEVLEEVCRKLEESYGDYDEKRLLKSIEEDRTGYSRWCHRGMLLSEGRRRNKSR